MKQDTNRKQNFLLRKLFSSTTTPIIKNDTCITLTALRKMVKTKKHKDMLKMIENETIPSVRKAWIDYFLEKTKSFNRKKSN
jgi:hypothetical protein